MDSLLLKCLITLVSSYLFFLSFFPPPPPPLFIANLLYQERDLSPDDKVSDSLSKFENLQVAMKEQKMTVNVKLLFKKRLFLSKELNNAMEKELVFHQAVTDLLMGVLPCSEEDVVALAALKLQVTNRSFFFLVGVVY